MTEKEKMDAGMLYLSGNEEIMEEQTARLELLYDYNATRPHEGEKRAELLKKMLGKVGEGCYIEPPFYSNWSGKHVFFGNNVYANFSLTLVDDSNIFVGDNVMFGPNVTVATAGHPIAPEYRKQGYQYNADVRIGNNVWIGAGAIIMPGVSIGDDSVIGGGSVVTRNIPSGVVAVGNPCRVLREIGERDREFYFRDRRFDEAGPSSDE